MFAEGSSQARLPGLRHSLVLPERDREFRGIPKVLADERLDGSLLSECLTKSSLASRHRCDAPSRVQAGGSTQAWHVLRLETFYGDLAQ